MIKKLLLLTLIGITTSVNAQVSTKDIYDVKQQIVAHTGHDFTLQFDMENADIQAYAFTFSNTVEITGSMLLFLQSKDEIALLLGHELGHLQMGHIGQECTPEVYKQEQKEELEADWYGAVLTESLGYDVSKASLMYYRMLDSYGEPFAQDCHPQWSDRIKLLRGM